MAPKRRLLMIIASGVFTFFGILLVNSLTVFPRTLERAVAFYLEHPDTRRDIGRRDGLPEGSTTPVARRP